VVSFETDKTTIINGRKALGIEKVSNPPVILEEICICYSPQPSGGREASP